MARAEQLIVFCYDIARDRTRARIAALLEDHGVRVQESVFECRMTVPAGETLLARLDRWREPGDSVRMYVIPETGRQASRQAGGAPIAERGQFWIL